MRVNLSQCDLQVTALPTYSSWTSNIFEKWICVYDSTIHVPRFTKGCSNSRKYGRIQIIYSERVYRELKTTINQIKTGDSNLMKQWNRIIVTQSGAALKTSLIRTGILLPVGTLVKGLICYYTKQNI